MNIIRELRKKAGIQQKELALLIGVSNPTVSEWENGKKDPSGDRLKKLAEYFGVDELAILGKSIPAQVVRIRASAVPIVGEIACGSPITAQQNIEGYADLPEGCHADFALRCKGDSMDPTFENGDIVLIRQTPDFQNGQIAAIGIEGEATLKHIYRQGDQIVCVPENHAYAPQVFSAKDITIYGIAVGFVRVW